MEKDREEELIVEDIMEKAGYFDWLSDNLTDLKAEFMMQFSNSELIQHFLWDEDDIDDFFDYHSPSFEEYCESSFNGGI